MGSVAETYERLPIVWRTASLVLLLPFAAELAQHLAEIAAGMYAPGGLVAGAAAPGRMIFGGIKVLTLLVTIVFLWRWWAFGNRDRARRLGPAFWRGLATFILVQIGAQLLLLLLGRALLTGVGAGTEPGLRTAMQLAPLLLWLAIATVLIPWFVGLLTEDPAMTLRWSAGAVRGRFLQTLGLLVAGILPLMIVHYALGYGAMGRPPAHVWVLMLADTAVVAALAVVIASTYFTIYRQAAARMQGGRP